MSRVSATHEDDLAQYGLLDGLEGDSRQERTDLIAWLHAQGFTIDQIRLVAPTPL
ncbi:adenylate cyclase regulatory domain-containing protein [Mycolicibacterium lutetiense]|uniref:adenylate cyclase regulatory domain-containing protein n=1 Tax=Mycolicibacterium lutetiense TaxID=1641992 RepID=UPI001AE38675|nr:adenylate cyclase regulatory domain-containing protein [Mycolicibacterium lutetiense]